MVTSAEVESGAGRHEADIGAYNVDCVDEEEKEVWRGENVEAADEVKEGSIENDKVVSWTEEQMEQKELKEKKEERMG